MRHKRTGLPSKGFVWAMLHRHLDQRAQFQLAMDEGWEKCLEKVFDLGRPVYVNGIFCGVFKRPKGWPDPTGPDGFVLCFRDCLFQQGPEEAILLGSHRRQNKRRIFEFDLPNVVKWKLADQLRASAPQIGHTREGLITQGGSKPGVSTSSKDSGTFPAHGDRRA